MDVKLQIFILDPVAQSFARRDTILLSTIKNLQYTEKLNGIDSMSFEINMLHPKLTKANFIQNASFFVITENDQPVKAFYFDRFSLSAKDVNGTVIIECLGIFGRLANRLTGELEKYSNEDIADVARSLITNNQNLTNGYLAITTESTTTGINVIDRTYEKEEIKKAIEELSNRGFDFEFIPSFDSLNNLQNFLFQVYYPQKGATVTSGSFELGINIQDFAMRQVGDFYNDITLKGGGITGSAQVSYNASSSSESASLQKFYTKSELFEADKRITNPTTLEEKLDDLVIKNNRPYFDVKIKQDPKKNPKNFVTGDSVYYKIKASDIKSDAGDFIDFEGYKRIEEIEHVYTDNGTKISNPILRNV